MTHRAERSRSMSFPRRVVAGTSDSLRSTNTQDSTILLQRPLELRFRPLTAAWLEPGPFPGGARRMEAERLRRTVLRWRSDKRVGCTILGSDSNETVLGALDRQTTSEGRPGKERAGTIHAMLDDDAWCDWYRRCHPAPLDDLLDLPYDHQRAYVL